MTDLDPGEALVPGSPTDIPHDPPTINPGDPDYVEPAAGVEPLPESS